MTNKLTIVKEDLSDLCGKFIMEVNDDDHNPFSKQSKGFLMEKRISFITTVNQEQTNYMLSGFNYPHGKPMSAENFIEKINNSRDGRHYRLLTTKELNRLFEFMKEDLLNLQ